MRKIESRILDAIAERRIGIVKLSKRDYIDSDLFYDAMSIARIDY